MQVDSPGLVQAVHELLSQHPGRPALTLWGSFKHKARGRGACEPVLRLVSSP